MVDHLSSKRRASIRIRLTVRSCSFFLHGIKKRAEGREEVTIIFVIVKASFLVNSKIVLL